MRVDVFVYLVVATTALTLKVCEFITGIAEVLYKFILTCTAASREHFAIKLYWNRYNRHFFIPFHSEFHRRHIP